MSDEVTATLREVNGQLVLDDPMALSMIQAVQYMNRQACVNNALLPNLDRIKYFVGRMSALNNSPDEFVIVILNVDDHFGSQIAEVLMPGHDWSPFRARAEVPFARGMASRDFIQECLQSFDPEASAQLESLRGSIVAVVVDYGVAVIEKC